MSLESYRAFAYEDCDYYELQENLGEVLSKGAIFVHDENDSVRGSIAEGCLLLCWTPDGNCYGGRANSGLGAETIVFHAAFTQSSLFKLVQRGDAKRMAHLASLSDQIEELRGKLDSVATQIRSMQKDADRDWRE